MSEHERMIIVDIPAQEAFRYLSSVSNLPDFLPHLRSLEEDEDDHVFGVADFRDGRRYEVSGHFRPDTANLRLDWGSGGTPGYRGWLQIVPEGADRSRITVHISMSSAAAETRPPRAGPAGDRIERDLDSVVAAIEQALEDLVPVTRSRV